MLGNLFLSMCWWKGAVFVPVIYLFFRLNYSAVPELKQKLQPLSGFLFLPVRVIFCE